MGIIMATKKTEDAPVAEDAPAEETPKRTKKQAEAKIQSVGDYLRNRKR